MKALLLFVTLLLPLFARADGNAQLERGKAALRSMTGCFLVDYNYTETEGLKPGYERDKRVYDVNKTKNVKEWIYLDELSPTRFRLQHVMFINTMSGHPIHAATLKHTGEDWEFGASSLYDFVSPKHWQPRLLGSNELWTRRVVNLDDGLRYQCAAAWKLDTEFPEWTCAGYAPIPGRETRDMGRNDYQALERNTRLLVYGSSYLDRQDNVKTIHDAGGKTPLAKEVGKTWYVRVPDSECGTGQAFTQPRRAFWNVVRESWEQVLGANMPFTEIAPAGQPSRYARMMDLEEKYMKQDLNGPVRDAAKQEVILVIEAYRER